MKSQKNYSPEKNSLLLDLGEQLRLEVDYFESVKKKERTIFGELVPFG